MADKVERDDPKAMDQLRHIVLNDGLEAFRQRWDSLPEAVRQHVSHVFHKKGLCHGR